MKKRLQAIALILMVSVGIAHAQDLNSVLKKHYKAMGYENLDKIKTLKIKASTSAMGMNTSMDLYIKTPKKSRVEVEVMGQKMVQGYDGTTAWMLNPMTGEAMEAPAAQKNQIASYAQIEGALWNYEEKGNELVYEGKATVGDKDYHKLKVKSKEGQELYMFIGAKDYLVDLVQSETQGTKVDIRFEDFKEIEGMLMYHKMSIESAGAVQMTMTYDEVTVNEDLKDTLFDMPK